MSITTVLNQVKTAGQARVAIGEGLNALGRTYPLLGKLVSDRAASARRELDTDRLALEAWYRQIKDMSALADYSTTWREKRHGTIDHAYVVIAGVEGEAHHKPQITNLEILTQSIKEAPAVFAQAAGEVTGAVGSAAGSAAGGIFKGLGISGTITIVLVGAVLLFILQPGLIFRLIGIGGKR